MGKSELEKPATVPVLKVAPDQALASQLLQGGTELLNLVAPGNIIQPGATDTSGFEQSLWQPMIEALLQQVSNSFLDWIWQAFKDYFAEPLTLLKGFQQLVTVLAEPHISMLIKSKALLDFLEAQNSLTPTATPYIAIAQHLHHIIEVQQQRAAFTVAHSVLTLKSLVALAHMPEVQALAGKHTLAPVQNLLRGALEMAQTWLHLSQASWDSPESVFEGLREADLLPGWVIEIVEQGQRLYEVLDALYVQAESKAELENAPPLKRFLTQFNESNDALGKFTALFYLLVDDTALPILNKYAGDAFGGLFKVFALLKTGQQAAPEDTSGMSAALLTLDHYTSKPFIARMSGAGEVGQLMAEPLSFAHAALRGSARQEAGMNMVLRLFDPKQTWTRFAKETIAEILWLPEKEQVWKLLTSDIFQHGKMIRALSQVLDNQFWDEYATASWQDLPALIGGTLTRDLQAADSQFVQAQSIASGVPAELIQLVLTATASIIASWKGDNWSDFLKASTQSVKSMVTSMANKGQLLPEQMKKVLNTCLFLTKNVARLINLWSLWHATQDKQQLGDESVALIRQLLVEHADDTTVWAFDKALIWLPVLPGLYRVLKQVQPIETGQRIQWVTRLLVSLYTQPEVQANPEIIWLREQVQRIAQEWLGAIPDAVLGKAVIEEVEAQPGPVQKAVIKSLYLAIDVAPPLLRLMKSAVNYASEGLLGDVIRGLLQPQASLVPLIMFLAVIPTSSEADHTPKAKPEPMDTTPVLGGVAAFTFMAAMVLAFKARHSYRKDKLAAQKQKEDADAIELLVRSSAAHTDPTSEQENLIENTTPPDRPVAKKKANNWQIEGALAGVSLLVFSASAYALIKRYTSSPAPTASDAARKIKQLCDDLLIMLAAPQEYFTADAVDHWLETLIIEVAALNESLASFDALLTSPPSNETTASPSTPPLASRKKRDTSDQTEQRLKQPYEFIALPISQSTPPNLESRDTIESDIKATKRVLAGFINELSERTRQVQEPFIENNRNYTRRGKVALGGRPVTETIADYNERISYNTTRIRRELTPAINDRVAKLKRLLEALNNLPKVNSPTSRKSLFFSYANIPPPAPIHGITTASALIAYPWDKVRIDTHGKLESFKTENTLVRAILYCDNLIAEIVRQRDETHATPKVTFTVHDRYNQDMIVILETREVIQDLIEYQFINNKRVDARTSVLKNKDRKDFMVGRIAEIIDKYIPGSPLNAKSTFEVEYHVPYAIHKEHFTLLQLSNGIHTRSNNYLPPSICVIKWGNLTSVPAQTEILALTQEWKIVKQINRDMHRTAELMRAGQSADLRTYDVRQYSETYIRQVIEEQLPNPQDREGISGTTRVWEKREESINPNNTKQRRAQLEPRYQSTSLLEILWGITEKKRLNEYLRTQLTYSHSPLFMGTTETGAAKVAKVLINRDFYPHYIKLIEETFKDAETIKLQHELINITLRSLKAYEPFSSVSLEGRVLPGVISGFKNRNEQIVYSFPDNKHWEFHTPIAVHTAYINNTDDFKSCMDRRQFHKNYLTNHSIAGLPLTFTLFTNPAEEIIKSYQELFTEDADLLVHSKSELETLKLMEQLKFGWSLISIFAGAFTVTSSVLGLIFGPLAPLIQSFAEDQPDEKFRFQWEAAASGIAELVSSIPNVRGFLASKATRQGLGLAPLVKEKAIAANIFSEHGLFKPVSLALPNQQPLVIPINRILIVPRDTALLSSPTALPSLTTPLTPAENIITVLPGPYKEDQWRKKELWANHYVFRQFEALKQAGTIRLNDDHNQYIQLSFQPAAENGLCWEFDSMIVPGSKNSTGAPIKGRKGRRSTIAEALINSKDLISALLAADPVRYTVSIDGQPTAYSSGVIISDDALSWEGIRFFDETHYVVPERNAYCDHLLLALNMTTTIEYFNKTLQVSEAKGSKNRNALDMLDYLITYANMTQPNSWPSRYTQDFIDTTLWLFASNHIITELLLEMLMTNVYSNYMRRTIPFSTSAVKTFMQRLAAQAAANIGYQPRYEVPRNFLADSAFRGEINTLKEKLTPDLATWLVIINYSTGVAPFDATDEAVATGEHPELAPASNRLNKDILVHDVDPSERPLEAMPEPILPIIHTETFADRTPVIGELTALYDGNKPISVPIGQSLRIRVKMHNRRTLVQEGIYAIPENSRSPHTFPHFVADLINQDFNNKILLNNTPVRLFAGTRKEVLDTDNTVIGYTYSLERADRINIYSNINQLNPSLPPYEVIIEFLNEYGVLVP
ncbi:hypothetical protein FJD38_20795 [Pseudomonas saxonica]|uniref:Tox-PLDMTX domain-containing protein n=1 Tax=Pseudomonas saxonica TaxID=2600598 RepID=A0ABY3GCQ7_9PSED|nr:hypothetical protein [Pseudomonas saxonica]TWR86674.1 hypothetical protein FJD38_20795 [Pseudomonas saxonica]